MKGYAIVFLSLADENSFQHMTITGSIYAVLIIAVERERAILHPLKVTKTREEKTKIFFGVGLILESPKGLVFIMLVDTQTFRESLMESFGSFVGGESEF